MLLVKLEPTRFIIQYGQLYINRKQRFYVFYTITSILIRVLWSIFLIEFVNVFYL